jgi:hypothetical protein
MGDAKIVGGEANVIETQPEAAKPAEAPKKGKAPKNEAPKADKPAKAPKKEAPAKKEPEIETEVLGEGIESRGVNIDDLLMDEGMQFRPSLSRDAIKTYAEAYESDIPTNMPDPVLVYDIPNKGLVLVGGYTRVAALRSLGRSIVPAKVVKGTRKEAFNAALIENSRHGVPRDNATKRAVAAAAIREYPKKSLREIGRLTGLGWNLISDVKCEIEGKDKPVYPSEQARRNLAEAKVNGHVADAKPDADDGATDGAGESQQIQDSAPPKEDAIRRQIEDCPLYKRLPEAQRLQFEAAADLYFRTVPLKESFKAKYQANYRAMPSGVPSNLYHYHVNRFLTLPGPDRWPECKGEDGNGCKCDKSCICRGRGFNIV